MRTKRSSLCKICHIITGLNDGGAEGVLFRLCTQNMSYHHVVISLSDDGKYGNLLRAKNIEVHSLGMSSGRPSVFAFVKLIQVLEWCKPDVVQTWMYHADLFGGIAARLLGIKSIAWGIRHTTLEQGKSKKTTIWIVKLLAKLSWWLPSRIVVCAVRAMDVHEALGYDRKKMHFIPNGYDLSYFSPRLKEGDELRSKWGGSDNIAVIGTVGRFNPQKDYDNFLHAIAVLRSKNVLFRCVMVGTNLKSDNHELVSTVRRLGLEETVMLLGPRSDVPAVMSALDLFVLPSAFGEAFPNVVAEAMACETPCVVTDVGDAAYIVGDTGWVVPPSDATELGKKIEMALSERGHWKWTSRKKSARRRILNEFHVQKMVEAYNNLWDEML